MEKRKERMRKDDTSELLPRRNVILRQTLGEKERKKERSNETNIKEKKDNDEKNNKGKKEDKKKEKTN